MSGLEALSLACNIFQVITFARETASFCKAIYNGDSSASLTILQEKADLMSRICAQIQEDRCKVMSTGEERSLAETATKCLQTVQELDQKVRAVVKYQKKGSIHKALVVRARYAWEKRGIEALESSLNEYRTLMETQQLSCICSRTQAVQLQQRQDFDALGDDLKNFIIQIAAGHTRMEDFVESEHGMTRDIMCQEHTQTRDAMAQEARTIQSHISAEIRGSRSKVLSEEQRQNLLKSFSFPEMNQRFHDIRDAHDATFQRVFQSYETTAEERSGDELLSDTERSESLQDGSISESSVEDDTEEIDEIWHDFVEWLQTDSRLFWIQGKPGSGKSTLIKFIVEHHATQNLVSHWSEDYRGNAPTEILAFFFWRIGTKFQNSIKGLLCSLIHQILSKDDAMIDHVLNRFTRAAANHSPHDWSTRSLTEALQAVLDKTSLALCIFVDGLDEICDNDGARSLLEIIHKLSSHPKVKLCVSSRPEGIFERHLACSAGLKLHDLTRPDMRQYIDEELNTLRHSISPGLRQNLATVLENSADGVFLWLYLAMRSLRNGIDHENTDEELLERLQMPKGDLNQLYEDMWRRLQDDVPLYRAAASELFQLVRRSEDRTALEIFDNSQGLVSLCLGLPDPTLFEIMVARNSAVQDALLSDSCEMRPEDMVQYCIQTRAEINTRCAGLLQVLPNTEWLKLAADFSLLSSDSPLFSQLATRVVFIHRTARDFLMDTKAGRRILGKGAPLEEHHEKMLKVSLCTFRQVHLTFGAQFNVWRFLCDMERCTKLGEQGGPISKGMEEVILQTWHAYETDIVCGLPPEVAPRWYGKLLFLTWLSRFSVFDKFILSIDKSSAVATRLLRETWFLYWSRMGPMTSPTLNKGIGGDAHVLDIFPCRHLMRPDHVEDEEPILVRLRSAFGLLLEGSAVRCTDETFKDKLGKFGACSLLESAAAMLMTCADLDQSISVVCDISDEGECRVLYPDGAPNTSITSRGRASRFRYREEAKTSTKIAVLEANIEILLLRLLDWLYYSDASIVQEPAFKETFDRITRPWAKIHFLRISKDDGPEDKKGHWFQVCNPPTFDDLANVRYADVEGGGSGETIDSTIGQPLEPLREDSVAQRLVEMLPDIQFYKDAYEMHSNMIANSSLTYEARA
ncbi:Vegetative incompatibility protein [Paramyrothecium foliicola]|nr:Vegetative incompatibility protein [Paramyrothecium foliicola]